MANRCDRARLPGFRAGVATDRAPLEGMDPSRAQPASLGPGELAVTARAPRAAVVASLAEALTRAIALGDEDAARIVHEAIGRLLYLPPKPEG